MVDPQAHGHLFSSKSELSDQQDKSASVTQPGPPVPSSNQWEARNPGRRGPSNSSLRDPASHGTTCSRHY